MKINRINNKRKKTSKKYSVLSMEKNVKIRNKKYKLENY